MNGQGPSRFPDGGHPAMTGYPSGPYTGPPPAALPPGWTQHFAPTGQVYYFNAASGQSTHVHPAALVAPHAGVSQQTAPSATKAKKEKPKVKDPIPGAPGWLRVTTNLGNVFYTHPETKRSEWSIPEEIAQAVRDLESAALQADARDEAESSRRASDVKESGSDPDDKVSSGADADQSLRPDPTLDHKRKRSEESPVNDEPGIDAADLIASRVSPLPADGDEKSNPDREEKRRKTGSPAGPASDDEDHNDNNDNNDNNEDQSDEGSNDEEDWQRQIAAEMAAEAEDQESDQAADNGAGQSRPPPPSGPPQPPLPPVSGFEPRPPPPGGYSGPPPGFSAAPPPAPIPQKLSLDEGRALFMHMLTGLNGSPDEVNPMAPWDKELPKFVHRSHYSALSNLRDRQDAFNDWCKARLREKREQKKKKASAGSQADAALAAPTSPLTTVTKAEAEATYRKLLEDNVKSTRMRFEDFRRDFKKDRRFYAFGRDDREREKLFRSFQRDLGEKKRQAAEAAEAEFVHLLESRFGDKRQGEDGRRWAGMSESDLKDSVWRDLKPVDGLDKQPAYDRVGSSSRRADLFVQWVKGKTLAPTATSLSQPNGSESKAHAASSETDKQQRRERALRDREEQARRQQEDARRANHRAHGEASREDGVLRFTELLVDAVRDPLTTWDAFSRAQTGDARFESRGLSFGRKQDMFEQHIEKLVLKKRNQLDQLFAKYARGLEVDPDVILPLVLDDSDYERLRMGPFVKTLYRRRRESAREDEEGSSTSDSKGVRSEFDRWQRGREASARQDFEEMLRENSFVEFWGRIRAEAAQKEAQGEDGVALETAAKAALLQNQAVGDSSNMHGVGINTTSEEDDEQAASLSEMANKVDLEEMHAVLRSDARYRAWKHRPELRDQWLRDRLASLGARKMTYWETSNAAARK
ncbi:unnamed protein product [Parajaminaea phylloscopi]